MYNKNRDNLKEGVNLELESNISKHLPTTRYQGSKRRIASWIYDKIKELDFNTVLDGFGGSASMSYIFKLMGKKVIFNDILRSNYFTGIALIENDSVTLSENDLNFLLNENGYNYSDFIQRTFKDIYYLDSENKKLDIIVQNIEMLSEIYSGSVLKFKKSLAYYVLFQSCLIKRPFNLFHRKNLNLRTANVNRSFGNKVAWDADFDSLFMRFNNEISEKIFSNGQKHKCLCSDILKIKNIGYDLVYLDPPYIRLNENRPLNYYSMYHFLEGLADYENWSKRIDWNTKNRRMITEKTEWEKNSIEDSFDIIFRKFQDSIIVISYGSPGIPSVERIKSLLEKYKTKVYVYKKEYNYKLNKSNGNKLYEILMIGI